MVQLVIEPGFCLLAALAVLIVPFPWLIGLVLAMAVHEMGHYLALKLCGVPVRCLRLTARGAILEVGHISGWIEFGCALAGPMAGVMLLWTARWLPRTALCALVQSVWNLLPIGQRDGARALRQMAGERMFLLAEKLTIVGVVIGCFCFRRIGLLAAMPAAVILAEKFLAKNAVKDYNRPTIDKEVRL